MPSSQGLPAPSLTEIPSDAAIVVRATRGLERLLAAEVTTAGHAVTGIATRQLVVAPADASILTVPPRLADDLFLLVAEAADPGPRRPALAEATRSLAVDAARWPPRSAGVFAVSASFVGRRNYSRFDIEDAIGAVLSRQGAGEYVSRRGGARPPAHAAQWRVTLDRAVLRLGLRPFPVPLHRRPWRTRTIPGSLHPPVAAAMAWLARLDHGHRVLDPCCGAGTILVEVCDAHPGIALLGRDVDPGAVCDAAHNAAGRPIEWRVGDAARRRDVPCGVDRIVTNPPWGVQRREAGLHRFLDRWRGAIRPGGLLVVLVDEPQEPAVLAHPGWSVTSSHPVSIAGRHPRILVARPR